MKTITTFLILFCSINLCSAQKAKLTKEETLKYINDLFNRIEKNAGCTFTLDGKILERTCSNSEWTSFRRNLMAGDGTIMIEECDGGSYCLFLSNGTGTGLSAKIENDAKRLKNALEHLIEILKAEPETDPFAN